VYFALGTVAVLAAAAVVVRRYRDDGGSRCGAGFDAHGARCCPPELTNAEGDAEPSVGPAKKPRGPSDCLASSVCPAPLENVPPSDCDAPRTRIVVPETDLTLSASDWEAEGRVVPRKIHTKRFAIDAFEITVGRAACPTCATPTPDLLLSDTQARAMGGLSREEAGRICAASGGRLPTDDEWLVMASGKDPHRYPWGDTGAVCRRAAWGLAHGPCAEGATGPDTVGAHPDGNTPSGIHDVSGNVAEWVVDPAHPNEGLVRGGHWASTFAADLRLWQSMRIDIDAHDMRVGARCAYDLDETSDHPVKAP
jgi:formylglycine-generating enzyme